MGGCVLRHFWGDESVGVGVMANVQMCTCTERNFLCLVMNCIAGGGDVLAFGLVKIICGINPIFKNPCLISELCNGRVPINSLQ